MTSATAVKPRLDPNRIRAFLEHPAYGPAPESDAKVFAWLDRHGRKFGHFIGGEWVPPVEGQYFATVAPARLVELAKVAQGSATDVARATKAAKEAFSKWNRLPAATHACYLYAIARAIARHARLFQTLEALDNGKTFREEKEFDVPNMIRHFYYHAGLAKTRDERYPHRHPGGVVAAIVPWNFPGVLSAWKVAPALAAGNTIVVKPSEHTSLSTLLFAEICEEVGLPRGVVNIVTGDGKTGEALVTDPIPWRIAFTGSTRIGRLIRKITAGSGKKVTLELGGKSAFIVFRDADIDAAIEALINAIFFNQGQVCCAGSRLFVHEAIAERFIRALKVRVRKLRAGDSLDKSVDIGAIVAEFQKVKVERYLAIGQKEGATMWQPENWSCPAKGYFVPPTIFTNVQPSHTIAREEIFGTVLVVMTFRTPDEAVALANNTSYGLAASVWTEDGGKALDVAQQLQAGVVWVNGTNLFDASSGFGGVRESGWGREGGVHGFAEMLIPIFPSPKQRSRKKNGAAPKRGFPRMESSALTAIDETHRFLIGGALQRPDEQKSFALTTPDGQLLATLGDANRKDVRNAVVAARKAFAGWRGKTAFNRSQILFFMIEKLQRRHALVVENLIAQTGCTPNEAHEEFQETIDRLLHWASWADKWEGTVPEVPDKHLVVASKEPIGVIGIRCPDEHPLLGAVNSFAPAMAMGNTVVLIAGRHALTAMDLVEVIQNSDVPAGVVNILTARNPDDAVKTLAEHEDVDAMWYFGENDGCTMVEAASAVSNLKRTFVTYGKPFDWMGPEGASPELFLDEATQVKNIWVAVGA